jgi:hypothetical protein
MNNDMMKQFALQAFKELLDYKLLSARLALQTTLRAMMSSAPEGAGDALKLAASEYFANQERLFLAELNQVFPDAKSKREVGP